METTPSAASVRRSSPSRLPPVQDALAAEGVQEGSSLEKEEAQLRGLALELEALAAQLNQVMLGEFAACKCVCIEQSSCASIAFLLQVAECWNELCSDILPCAILYACRMCC